MASTITYNSHVVAEPAATSYAKLLGHPLPGPGGGVRHLAQPEALHPPDNLVDLPVVALTGGIHHLEGGLLAEGVPQLVKKLLLLPGEVGDSTVEGPDGLHLRDGSGMAATQDPGGGVHHDRPHVHPS